MSKEIAQTVGGKRIAWLIAIVAAFAVFATLGTQWRESAAVPSLAPAPPTQQNPASGSVAVGAAVEFVATANVDTAANAAGSYVAVILPAGYTITNTACALGTAVGATVASAGASSGQCNISGTATTAGTITATVTATVNSAGALAGGQARVSDGTATATSSASAGYTGVAVGSASGAGVIGGFATVSYTLPAGITYCSDGTGGNARSGGGVGVDVTIAGHNAGTSAIVNTPTTAADTTTGTHTITGIADDATAGVTVTFSVHAAGAAVGADCADVAAAVTYGVAELRHLADDGTVITVQDLHNNVRGSRHTVCTVLADTTTGVALPGVIDLSNIVVVNGGGYANLVDTDPNFVDVNFSPSPALAGATCFSWMSTDAGDQQISLIYAGLDGVNRTIHWDTNNSTSAVNKSLIKEWNRLEDSWLKVEGVDRGTAAAPTANVSITQGVVLNPATGKYQITTSDADIDITDVFQGSHTNAAGVVENDIVLAGVAWTAVESGCDADVSGALSGTTVLTSPSGAVNGGPSLAVKAGDCLPGQSVTITITGREPGALGSGAGLPVVETVTITFTQNIAEKQVFLAWAGQRIILEHDWRLPAGDTTPFTVDGPTPVGACAFYNPAQTSGDQYFRVQYIKGTGPGNFVAGLNAQINNSDEAWVSVNASDASQSLESRDEANDATDNDDDINNRPQDNCISRVLFESEDPGEVDIEAFAYDDCDSPGDCNNAENVTKVAFVVYYMKINTINVSLVTQVSKPTHNSSSVPDYAPGNPWDASKDDADNAADWNVSKDLLVRGRVTGWFTNSNPSGRAADTSNPLNVLPANRWVMPNDWPLLAGGPADPADGTDAVGTAENFRPYYDILFAPNNTRGIALTTPEGADYVQVTSVLSVASFTNTTSSFVVASCGDLTVPPAKNVKVGASGPFAVASCASSVLTISGSTLTSAPAAGTPIWLATGVPFEGPYSPLDIVGLHAQGLGGAALSNYVVGSIRDAALDDGDVDMWDAPMPPANVSVAIRGTGFIKQVIKSDVYYTGTPNVSSAQVYPNPFYIVNIPDSPFIPAVAAGGGFLWNSWGNDGPGGDGQGVYRFWWPVLIGTNSEGIGEALSTADSLELGLLRAYFGDSSIARDLVVFSDNHGEFMVTANGDFKTDLTACTTNILAGGKHCKQGDKVGTGTITATVDYPDFRGKHFPVLSNAATVTWTWGGYKDVTVEKGETDQYKYIVFHALDRDGFCSPMSNYPVLLHSVLSLSGYTGISDDADTAFTVANLGGTNTLAAGGRYYNDPVENVDFLIDSGEGIIIGTSSGSGVNDGKQFATGIPTFSTYENEAAGKPVLQFAKSPLAAADAKDECQAWIKVSNSLLGILNVLTIAHDDEGNIGFDKIIDLTNTTSYTLNFRWSLVTWAGADNISVTDALKGTGKNTGGNDISASVTAVYGWDAAAQQWLGYFPSGVNVPGANDLTALKAGSAYWVAITGPSSVTWTIASNVD